MESRYILTLHGSTHIQLELPPEKICVNVIVADTLTDVILGHEFLCSTAEIGSTSDVLHVKSRGQSVSIAQSQPTQCTSSFNVVMQESLTYSEVELIECTPECSSRKILDGAWETIGTVCRDPELW